MMEHRYQNKGLNLKLFSLALMLMSLSLATGQVRYTVEQVPNVQLQDYLQYVSDPERVLSYEDINTLNYKLNEMRDSLGVQIAVVVIPAIDQKYSSAKEFATLLFNRWGIGGSETNNGLLILLLTADDEREIVFETGYGLEETLTDGLSKLIQTREMIPFLAGDEYGAGLIAGVDEVEKVMQGTSELIFEPITTKEIMWIIIIWLVVGVIVVLISDRKNKKQKSTVTNDSPYQALIGRSSAKGLGCATTVLFFPVVLLYRMFKGKKESSVDIKCESCRSQGTITLNKGEPVIRQQALPDQDGMKEYEFTCSKCGFVHKELVSYKYMKPVTESSSSGSTTYRSYGSGGNRGGSWGGGRSGGGGASSKF